MAERNKDLGTIEWSAQTTGPRLFGANRSRQATSGPLPADGYNDREAQADIRRRAIKARLVANGVPGQVKKAGGTPVPGAPGQALRAPQAPETSKSGIVGAGLRKGPR